MNSSVTDTHCGQFTMHHLASLLPPVLIIELLLGVPANMMALWVFCCHLHSWKPNVVYLINLALADFLLLLILPFRIHYLLRQEDWVFGRALCQIKLFMIGVNRSASIAFMTTVAVDRFFKVVHPHHKVNFISSMQAAGIACFIWVVVISLRLPLLTNNLLFNQTNLTHCRSFNSYKVVPLGIQAHYTVYVAEFFLPLVILVFCSIQIVRTLRHHKKKRKNVRRSVRTFLAIVGIFIICFFPGVATGLAVLYIEKLGEESCNTYKLSVELFSLTIGFTYMNSALDPLIYCFSSSMFQDVVTRTIHRFRWHESQSSKQTLCQRRSRKK